MANWATSALGDPRDPAWQEANLTWIEPIKGQRWQVYKPAAADFTGLLTDLAKLGYHPTSSGGFNYRNIRGSPDKLSQHAYGTAIDLNAMTNAMGQSASDIPHAAELAAKYGLDWGGLWKGRPDPMHFEYQGRNEAGGGAGAPADPHQQWVAQMWPLAQAQAAKTGVDPRVIMAQAALETGWGKSAPNNNYFGIKGQGAGQQTLEFVNGKMTPTQADFRTYKNPEEAFTDYGNLLMGQRYADVRGAKGLDAQIAALGKSGYATDPDYASKLLSIATGIPEGGYKGAGGPVEAAGGGAGNEAGSGAAPAPTAAPEPNWLEKIATNIGKGGVGLAGRMGGQGPVATRQPYAPAARVDQGEVPTIDPAASQRQALAMQMALARLNSGKLYG